MIHRVVKSFCTVCVKFLQSTIIVMLFLKLSSKECLVKLIQKWVTFHFNKITVKYTFGCRTAKFSCLDAGLQVHLL